MAEKVISSFGIKRIWIRFGGKEVELKEAQEAAIKANFNVVELKGDDNLIPVDTQPSSMEMEISGSYGRYSLDGIDAMMGGTETQHVGPDLIGPDQGTGGCSMADAISLTSTDPTLYVSMGYSFVATSATTYDVINTQGVKIGSYTVGYPQTGIIPGVTVNVNGTLTTNSWAHVSTVKSGDSHEESLFDPSNFPAQVGLRVVTEKLAGQGLLEWEFLRVQPMGATFPLKTKDFAKSDFSFKPLVDDGTGLVCYIRKYTENIAVC